MRQYALIRFIGDENLYPFKQNVTYIYFGEIPNMPGHIILMEMVTGKFFAGWHEENFEEVPEDET
jgi:hypothetical protein